MSYTFQGGVGMYACFANFYDHRIPLFSEYLGSISQGVFQGTLAFT